MAEETKEKLLSNFVAPDEEWHLAALLASAGLIIGKCAFPVAIEINDDRTSMMTFAIPENETGVFLDILMRLKFITSTSTLRRTVKLLEVIATETKP